MHMFFSLVILSTGNEKYDTVFHVYRAADKRRALQTGT